MTVAVVKSQLVVVMVVMMVIMRKACLVIPPHLLVEREATFGCTFYILENDRPEHETYRSLHRDLHHRHYFSLVTSSLQAVSQEVSDVAPGYIR